MKTECNLISPEDEGPKAYVGAVCSSIFWAILAIIIIIVGIIVDDPDLKFVMGVLALTLFLLLPGIGLFQPVIARSGCEERAGKLVLRYRQGRLI